MIREFIVKSINDAIHENIKEKVFISDTIPDIMLEIPKEEKFGNFSTNIGFLLSKSLKKNPRDIAEKIIKKINKKDVINEIKIEGPGFINIFLRDEVYLKVLIQILNEKESYGKSSLKKEGKINLEFVSVNPTGPVHVAHGRWASVGDSLANLLEFAGYNVSREYYVNDYGAQIDLLARSVEARYLQIKGAESEFPEDGYQGNYITDFAREIDANDNDVYLNMILSERFEKLKDISVKRMLDDIKKVMINARVNFDTYFSENSLHDRGEIDKIFNEICTNDLAYKKDGAWWFKTSEFYDDKDRVIKKENGETTYFLSDIAYHINKLERGFSKLINIWGADHHSHVARMQSALKAFNFEKNTLEVLLGQLVNLIKDGQPVKMSKRAGNIVTFQELIDEVGIDAVRFLFLTRSINSHLDFDIDLAKQRSSENPVYYVQYAHARICSLNKKAVSEGIVIENINFDCIKRLNLKDDINLIGKLESFPYLIEEFAEKYEPHHLTFYLGELASEFHSYYNKNMILQDDMELAAARLLLMNCIKIVISNGLRILGVSSPESM